MRVAGFARWRLASLAGLVLGGWSAPAARAEVALPGAIVLHRVDFERHVMGLLGRLGSPGVYPITGPTTLLEAISLAGGPLSASSFASLASASWLFSSADTTAARRSSATGQMRRTSFMAGRSCLWGAFYEDTPGRRYGVGPALAPA